MKKLLLLFGCISAFAAKSQNGFTTYTTNLAVTGISPRQTAFLVDNSSNKWIGFRAISIGTNVASVGLAKYDNNTWTFYNTTSTPAMPSNMVNALAKDNSGNIWVGTDAGLVKYNGTSFTTYNTSNGLPSNTITCIESSGNQIYVGTRSGLSRFDGSAFTNYNVANGLLPNDTITCIKAETAGLLWLGGKNRMVEFTINGSLTTTGYVNHTIPQTAYYSTMMNTADIVNCIYIDSQNAKWLGTSTAGIVNYNGSTFQNANQLYQIYGSAIPNKVLDIATGFHGGFIFRHVPGSAGNMAAYSGLTELALNNSVYQYYHSTSTFIFGDYVENDGADLLISQGGVSIGYVSPKMYYGFNLLNYSQQLGPVSADNFKMLDINNVKAGIANRGDMHWDMGGNGSAVYEVPKGSGKNSNYCSALWIGGLDNGGQLHGGAQTYRQGGVDFWPGPLDTITATINSTTATNYDKIWKVSYTDINNFITAYNSGSVVATPDMLTWPAHGAGNNSKNLAPFVDYNADGLYNPNDGDYPKIKGDQTLYFIYNDMLATHGTSFTPMGIEVQGMAYAYGCPGVVNGHNELTYTTFYDYKITNRSSNNYHDVYVSMWSDVDLGYYGDDYIGSDVGDNYGYAYNADATDESVAGVGGYGTYIPAQGFNIVKGPMANLNDGIDNNNNGITDEPGEDCKLNKFTYFHNSFPGVPAGVTDPLTGQQFYNYMTGYWKDGSPFTCGGNAYGGTTQTNYVYTADTYTNGACGPTPWYESSVPGDRRMILSSGPFNLNAGQTQEVEYAFVTSFDSTAATGGSMSLSKLKTDIQKINTFYNQVNKPNCLQSITIGVSELLKQDNFALYPNPAKSTITVASTIIGTVKVNYAIMDVLGKVVMENENTGSEKFAVNISTLNSGIYFLRLQVNNSVVVKKFIKE
ncbi:MAG: T9SS type A sorting domain-containing protein [Bacteroidota bacterium]